MRYLTYTPRQIAALLMLAGAAPLIAALISQYGFDYPPCELCVYQRYPYVLTVLAGAFAWLRPAWFVPLLWLGVAGFFTTAAIALFHTGVEQEWWQYASACSSLSSGDGSLDGLRGAIFDAPLVSCKQTTFAFLALSMASWNVITGGSFALCFAVLAQKRSRI